MPRAIDQSRPKLVCICKAGLCMRHAGIFDLRGRGPVLVQLDRLVDEV